MSHVHEDGGSLAGNDASPTSSVVGPVGIAASSAGAAGAASISSALFLCMGSASRSTRVHAMEARLHPEVTPSALGVPGLTEPRLTP
jgi:hypothetical protein